MRLPLPLFEERRQVLVSCSLLLLLLSLLIPCPVSAAPPDVDAPRNAPIAKSRDTRERSALPLDHEPTFLNRATRDTGQPVNTRLSVAYPCKSNRSCYPNGSGDSFISSRYVSCQNGACVCNSCFVRVNDSCALEPCHHYDTTSSECVDERRSQKTVFLLSFFLSSVGAANFYIAQYGLAGAQLALFILMVSLLIWCFCGYTCMCCENSNLLQILCCCCCNICCEDCYDDYIEDCCSNCDGAAVYIVGCSTVVIIALLLVIIFWWATDLSVFIENIRNDGNHCPIKLDL